MKKLLLITIVAIIALSAAYYLIAPAFTSLEASEASPLDHMDSQTLSDFNKEMEAVKDVVFEESETFPSKAKLISQATFKPRAHEVEGEALLIESEKETTLRFENFETINGPNLHIYLSSDLEANDFIDLGKIKATKGNVNYKIPTNTNTTKYNKVLVWCVPFKVLFSYADLN
jgi:hypothetical protein